MRSILHDISMSELHRMRDEGLTLKEVAEKAGICMATASRYLKGYKRKPITETMAERIPLKAAESVRIVSDDEAVRIARERFNQRMNRSEQPMEHPTEQKPTVYISHIAYEGKHNAYEVYDSVIQIHNIDNNALCSLRVEKIDEFIAELQGIKQMITAIKPLLCKEKKDDDTSDD